MNDLVRRLDQEIFSKLSDDEELVSVYEYLSNNVEIASLHDMANIVLVQRLKFNDHGRVHARITTLNALKIVDVLGDRIVNESWRDLRDSKLIVMVASFLHDVGNAVNRDEHELLSVFLSKPFVEDVVSMFYDDPSKRVKISSMIYEAIMCHMGRFQPTSLEAGVVATADGCDMEEERARLPYKMGEKDIHKYSALAIQKVNILPGEEKPLRIEVKMKDPSGVFQIEEILMKKIKGTNFQDYVEIIAIINGEEVIKFI